MKKSKDNTKIIIGAVAAGAIAGIALKWKEIRSLFSNGDGAIDNFNPAEGFPLYPSTRYNPLVAQVQNAMLKHPLAKGIIERTGGADGYYGDGTKEALSVMSYNSNRITKQDFDKILKDSGLSGLGCICQLETANGWKAPFDLEVRFMDGRAKTIRKNELIGWLAGAEDGIAVFIHRNEPVAFNYL